MNIKNRNFKNRPMIKFTALSFAVSLFMSAPLHAESTPIRTATDFYQWLIQSKVSGLPTETELNTLKKFFSADLIYLLHASLAAEERCVAITPADLKPRQFEGSLFVDNYEGLTKVNSLTEQKIKNKTTITAQLEYTNPQSTTDSISWNDSLIMSRENQSWVISDIRSVRNQHKLSSALKKYISKQECGM